MLTCRDSGVNGDIAAESFAEIKPGQELGFGWRHDRDYKGIIMTPGRESESSFMLVVIS